MIDVRVEETVGLIRLGSEEPDVEDRRTRRLGAIHIGKRICQSFARGVVLLTFKARQSLDHVFDHFRDRRDRAIIFRQSIDVIDVNLDTPPELFA